MSTSQAPEFSCRWTPLSWAVSSYIGRLYLQLTEGFPCLASRRNELNQECLCFDKLNMTENTEHRLKTFVIIAYRSMRFTTVLVREDTNRDYRYQTTCSILTPANNAALKALAIAEGGTTVVANRACELSEGNVFSGEVMEECIVSTASMSSRCSVWALLRSKVQKMVRPRGEIKRSLLRSFINLIFEIT